MCITPDSICCLASGYTSTRRNVCAACHPERSEISSCPLLLVKKYFALRREWNECDPIFLWACQRKPPKRRRWRMQRGGFEEAPRFPRQLGAGIGMARRWRNGVARQKEIAFVAVLGKIFVLSFGAGKGLCKDELTLPPSPLPLIRRLKPCPAQTCKNSL